MNARLFKSLTEEINYFKSLKSVWDIDNVKKFLYPILSKQEIISILE
jgi:hypothetical protein